MSGCLAFQVLLEVALSLVLCLWAALKAPGSFLPILPDAKENRCVSEVLLLFGKNVNSLKLNICFDLSGSRLFLMRMIQKEGFGRARVV